jgi:hypothetical protein
MTIEWKKILAEILVKLGLLPEKFTGKIEIEFAEGGVRYLEKRERLK